MTTPEPSIAQAPEEIGDGPLVSVIIATRNRAQMLRDSIHSVLCQTHRHLEVIIVDDGSEDDTPQVVEAIADPRVRYVRQGHAGISAARNRGTAYAQGEWIAVHDDDDIMLPYRLTQQLRHADEQVDFVYGAFINFDDETGELQMHHGRNYGYGAALMSGFAPGHSTWLVRTEIMRRFPYDEGIASAVDNNLVFRMLRSGVRFRHSGVICLLRRVHSGRITATGGTGQKYVANLNRAFLGRGVAADRRARMVKAARYDWGPVDKTRWQARLLPYLPDHLVVRAGYVSRSTPQPAPECTEGDNTGAEAPHHRLETVDVTGMDWWTFMETCARGGDTDSVRARPRESDEIEALFAASAPPAGADHPDLPREALTLLLKTAAAVPGQEYFAIATLPEEQWTPQQLALTAARCTVIDGTGEATLGLIPVRSWAAATTLRETAFDPGAVRVLSTKKPAEILADLGTPA